MMNGIKLKITGKLRKRDKSRESFDRSFFYDIEDDLNRKLKYLKSISMQYDKLKAKKRI